MSTVPPTTIPHGSWPGSVSIDDVLNGARSLVELRTDDDDVFWLETRPWENGRSTIMALLNGEADATELTPQLDVRARVMEYGGGAWAVQSGQVVAWDDRTRQLWRAEARAGSAWEPVTEPNPNVRLADLVLDPQRALVVAVAEDHSAAGEPVTRLVSAPLGGGTPTTLVEGADFYASPALSADGTQLAWVEWGHPNMPWDHTRVMVADVDAGSGSITNPTLLSSGSSSALHPRWAGSSVLYLDDVDGYWNWYQAHREDTSGWQTHPVTASQFDHEDPMWTLGNQTWDVWPPEQPHTLLGQQHRDGVAGLISVAMADDQRGAETQVEIPDLSHVDAVAATLRGWYVIASFTNRPTEVLRIDPQTRLWTTVAQAGAAPDPASVSVAQSIWTQGQAGPVQSWYYAPTNPTAVAPADDRPPLIVLSHGGPTGASTASWSPKVQYWTSRGFAVVDVNYSGSTGFGRDYRNRLRGQWGVLDVADCQAVVQQLIEQGVVDRARVAITGGSAGGFTTLASLVTTDTYTAGVSRYGIGDLATLAADTHKFEARYLDGLVGRWPQDEQVYRDRSPIHHVDRLATPMLILQGTEDKVVPPAQAEQMAAAVKAAGQPVAMVMFEGEGHGFRGLEARRAALLAEQAFYTELWRLTPADELPTLTWL